MDFCLFWEILISRITDQRRDKDDKYILIGAP